MDALVIIILITIIALALIAIAVSLHGKWISDSAAAYDKRMSAEREYDTAILRAAKVMVVGEVAFVTKGVNRSNEIMYDRMPVNSSGSPITADTIDGEKITAHQIASRLIDESINRNGAQGIKLLSANEWEQLGNDRAQHGQALEYLSRWVYVRQGGKASEQGSFVKDGMTLQTVLRDLAIYALPLATGQQIKKTA